MTGRGCKIYYSIAFICYLEVLIRFVSQVSFTVGLTPVYAQVVIWTTVVLAGCGAVQTGPEGSAYLSRETVSALSEHTAA